MGSQFSNAWPQGRPWTLGTEVGKKGGNLECPEYLAQAWGSQQYFLRLN